MKNIRLALFSALLIYGLSFQANANLQVERPEFIRVELVSISLKPVTLVVRDELDDTQTIRLAQGAKITANGKVVKTEKLQAGDVLYIATRQVVSNIIVSDENPLEAELALHKSKPKLIEVTVDEERLEQSAKQFYIAFSLALLGLLVIILLFILKTSKRKNTPSHNDEKRNRRSI